MTNENESIELDETIHMTAIGNDTRDGVILAEVRLRLNERWATEEDLRAEQLRCCVRVKMKMYNIKGPSNTVRGENIDIDFNGNEGDTWVRTKKDRAGDEAVSLTQLKRIAQREAVVIGYRMDREVKKIKIGTTSFSDLLGQIDSKCIEWGRSIHVWSSEASVWMDSVQQEGI